MHIICPCRSRKRESFTACQHGLAQPVNRRVASRRPRALVEPFEPDFVEKFHPPSVCRWPSSVILETMLLDVFFSVAHTSLRKKRRSRDIGASIRNSLPLARLAAIRVDVAVTGPSCTDEVFPKGKDSASGPEGVRGRRIWKRKGGRS